MTETLKKLTLGALCAMTIGAATGAQAQTVVIGGWHRPHVMFMVRHHRRHVWYHNAWSWRDDVWLKHHHGWRTHR